MDTGGLANNPNDDVDVCQVSSVEEIRMIKALQEANLGRNLSSEDSEREGFVTAEYTVEFLEILHQYCPSIIAKNCVGEVVGYALVVTRDVYGRHDLLTNLIDEIFTIEYKGRPLKGINFVLVGQLCVAKGYRGRGLVPRMYNFFKEALKANNYDCALTDVAESNPRSLKAHHKSGFSTLKTFVYEGNVWHIVILDFY